MTRAWCALLLAASVVGCSEPVGAPVQVRWLDELVFEQEVQPIVAEHCANPSCHGRPERALSLFSPQAYRADPARRYLREPLDAAELDHNYTVCCVLAGDSSLPEQSLLLRKARGSAAQSYHGGGVIFASPADEDYRTMLRWLEEGW